MAKKNKFKQKTDPYAEREARKYERPIPSRELIMEVLAEAGEPMGWQQVAAELDLHHPDDLEALSRRLRAMERDGQVVRNRRDGYGLLDKMDLVRGRVLAHPDGFGFLVPDDGSDDLFLSARQMRALMHNDRIVAHVSGIDRRGRREGAVVEVLERNTHQVVGRIQFEGSMNFVIPDNKRITHDILVPHEHLGGAEHEQIVLVELIEQPSRRRQPMGRVIEVLGDHMAPGMEIDVAIRAYEIPHVWPEAVEDEVSGLKPEVPEEAKQGREDIRKLPLVTIDGEDARDFDDAVYCEPNGKGWRLWVAIADVSHYVAINSGLDHEAQQRGNSVYFPGRVVPMLPEVLSNGLCSINPKVDRLCMVCEMEVSSAGQVQRHRFFEGLMRSHARLTYNKVAAMLGTDGLDGDKDLRQEYSAVYPHLENLHKLYRAFDRRRKRRGAIEFETTETTIVFGKEKKIERIVPLVRNDAHKMIEECMIAANVEAAKFLAGHEMPTLYRIHETPKEDKLTDLRAFLGELGLDLPGGDQPEAGHYAELLASVRERPDAHLIQTVMLRSLNQAVYSPDNKGHFGLALGEYAHFTSPIRRYPDLLVHRAIRHVLRSGGGKRGLKGMTRKVSQWMGAATPAQSFHYSNADMLSLGETCSTTERRADEATRDAADWLKCEYMLDKVGESFEGIITSVTSFGLFVELDDIYVEGLVHVTSLKNDYYHFDAARHSLQGEHSRKNYQLGDKVRVQVVRVNLDDRKIDFELEGEGEVLARPPRKRSRKAGGKKGGGAKKAAAAPKGAVTKKAGAKKKSAKQGAGKPKAAAEAAPKKKAATKKRRRRSCKKTTDKS